MSGRTLATKAGSTSGSGLEQAKITAFGAMLLTSSSDTKPGPETPSITSAPLIASDRVLGPASLINLGFSPLLY